MKNAVLGAIIGDIVGSRFEFDNYRNKDFQFFHPKFCRFTDDSVMTLAVAKALIDCNNEYSNLKRLVIKTMVDFGRKYPGCGYGGNFFDWLKSDFHEPYGSYGNGAAMRVGAIPVMFDDARKIKMVTRIVTDVSHNHEDSEKGAEAVCMAIYLALKNNSSETVKPALIAFFESKDFEDAIRNAIAIGGDSDTIGAITGSIAGAYYGISSEMRKQALNFLDDYLKDIYLQFEEINREKLLGNTE